MLGITRRSLLFRNKQTISSAYRKNKQLVEKKRPSAERKRLHMMVEVLPTALKSVAPNSLCSTLTEI